MGDVYEGREQTFVKHEVLRRYLQKLAFKVGNFQPGTTLNYIDGFSGPWDAVKDDHGDSSPAIAMRELAAARAGLAALAAPKAMTVRCFFVEKDAMAFERLTRVCASAPTEARAIRGELEEQIDDATRFAGEGRHPFAFIFIDPTGWTGFALQRIAPLLQVQPSEVLINFMLPHIARFIDDDDSTAAKSFEELYWEDAADYRARWKHLTGPDREDAIVQTYCDRVRQVGRFEHCVSTVIVNPTADRTHYRLVFATRSRKGLTAFRDIERAVTPQQQGARATAKQRKREEKTGPLGLLGPTEMDTDYFASLVARYRAKARAAIEAELAPGRDVAYETLIDVALGWPMTSERELKTWLRDMKRAGRIELRGLGKNERAPKLDAGHRVCRTDGPRQAK